MTVADVASQVMREAIEMFGDVAPLDSRDPAAGQRLADLVWGHFLNRWYRFVPLVTTRSELEDLTVKVSWYTDNGRLARDITLTVIGTPLENRTNEELACPT